VTWVRLDDALEGHRKRRRAGLEAFGLWCAALCYCGRYHTDGYVDAEWMAGEAPHRRTRDKLVGRLVSVGLLDPLAAGEQKTVRDQHDNDVKIGPFSSDGWVVHDFLDLNPSSVEIAGKREKERLKKAKQRGLSPGDTPGDAPRDTPGTGRGTPRARASRPVPVPVEQTTTALADVAATLSSSDRFEPLDPQADSLLLRLIRQYPKVDPLEAATKACVWSLGPDWRTTNPVQAFETALRKLDEWRRDQAVRERDKPTANGMIPDRDTCIDCGTGISTGVRCRDCACRLEERLTGGGRADPKSDVNEKQPTRGG
jgi:hypothetical protein